MAASNQKSDLIQIVMLTFFLCAVFFTGWGIHSNIKVGRLRTARAQEQNNLEKLGELLAKPESRDTLQDWRRREKSKSASTGQIDTLVSEVLRNSTLSVSTANGPTRKSSGAGESRLFEHEYRISFHPAAIDAVYRFLARLEAEHPHVEFKSVRVSSEKRKEDDPDEWGLDLTLATYTTEG